ncbi:MAG: dipeptidase [Oscillospiraceae bacterium]|nr:dipeptidase [Oscillospiraceae bacterium]
MIEPLYKFHLSEEQEARARDLHESSIILDMLFQGPVGTYSLPEGAEEELLELARSACPGDEVGQCDWATNEILRRMLEGSYAELYRQCWYDSGLTGGCRQLSITDRETAFRSALALQEEFDKKPWLVKCTSTADIRRCKAEGLKAGIVTSQEAAGYGKDLELLELLWRFGLRVQQLSYNNQNLIGAGCMEPNGGAGLSKFGIRFVERCNELGIVVDTGHCGYHTTMDACRYSRQPVVATHTGAERLYLHERCKSDEELRAIAGTGGVVGIFAMPWFIAEDPDNTTVEHFLDHIEYVAELVGVDHVGIGTDWPMPQTKWSAKVFKKYVAPSMGFAPGNGPSTEWVHGLKDYRSFLNVTRGLVARGRSDEDIRKILGENWLRVFDEVWKSGPASK